MQQSWEAEMYAITICFSMKRRTYEYRLLGFKCLSQINQKSVKVTSFICPSLDFIPKPWGPLSTGIYRSGATWIAFCLNLVKSILTLKSSSRESVTGRWLELADITDLNFYNRKLPRQSFTIIYFRSIMYTWRIIFSSKT